MMDKDIGLADYLLKSYFDALIRLQYLDSSHVPDYLHELAELNNATIHDFIVAALLDYVIGMKQEPDEQEEVMQ